MNTPRSLGRYNILEAIGQGMQGRIFRARDEIFGEVALKAAKISESATAEEVEEIRRRLEVEARRQRELSASCASILPAYDVLVAEDGQVYVVQAYAEGGRQERSLSEQYEEWAARTADAWPRTAAVLRKVARSYRSDARREDEEAQDRLDG